MTAELTRSGSERATEPESPAHRGHPPAPRGRRRGAAMMAALVGAVAIAVGGGLAVTGFDFGGADATDTGSQVVTDTAEVTLEDLVETEQVDGTLGYGDPTQLAGRAAGTMTWLPADGSRILRGQTLYEVDERPVTLMYGAVPMYRTLSPGADGADVKQLEQNLRKLGYTGFTVDREYTSATADAVEAWQDDRGLAETGTVDPGQVVFAPGAVRVAGHLLELGDGIQPGMDVLDLTSIKRVITVDLDVADQTLATKGAAVTVELPDRTVLHGHIASVGKVAEVSSDSATEQPGGTDESATIEVTVTLDEGESAGAFDQAPVQVNLESERHEDVLTVPVAALVAVANGRYAVRVVENGAARTVPVETGAYAAGRVEVQGAGLTEGVLVEVPAS